jgi:hypothetical protein
VRGAIAPRGLELQLHLPGRVELHPLVRQCRPGDGAAQLFQPLAVVRLDPHGSVQAESVDVGAQGLARRSLARHCTSQGQHLLPGAGPEGDAIRHSRRLQRSQRACLFAFGLRLGQPGLAHVFHQHAPASSTRSGIGRDSTHCRTGTCGMTWSTRCAAVCDMRRAPHDGQKPRRLQLKARSLS